jgi:hypothetical protein
MDVLNALHHQKEKNIEFQQNNLLKEAYSILKGDVSEVKNLSVDFFSHQNESILTAKPLVLDTNRVFSIKDIKSVCIDFRLRFLDKKYYRAELPYDAHIKLTAFEIEIGVPVSFKILTEVRNFKTTYPHTQQLLFADLGNGEFYFIHKWGNEFSTFRKYAAMPYKNIEFLFGIILIVSSVLTIITPTNFITTKPNIDYFSMIRLAFFFWCVVALSALFTYYIVAIRKGMNSSEWDSATFM